MFLKKRNLARWRVHSWIKDAMKMKILSPGNLLDVCGISSALFHMIQAWIPGWSIQLNVPPASVGFWTPPRSLPSAVTYFCSPSVFSSISASRQRNLHMKEKRGIQWGGTNGLSSVTFYRTGLLCQDICIVNITRTFRLSSNENCLFFSAFTEKMIWGCVVGGSLGSTECNT